MAPRVNSELLLVGSLPADSAESAGRLPTSSSSLFTRGAIAASFRLR